MPSARDARAGARTARPDAPFGSPNLDEVFEILIPEGAATGKIPASDQYLGKLLTVAKRDAKSSGNPMWVFNFTISEGEYAGMDFAIFCVLTPNALWKLTETLAALGVRIRPGEQVRFKAADVMGVGVRLVIVDDKSQDGTREISKLNAVLPHPKGAGFRDDKSSSRFGSVPLEEEEEEEELEEVLPRKAKKAVRRPLEEEEEEIDEEEEEQPRAKKKAGWDMAATTAPSRRGRRVEVEEEEEEEEAEPVAPSRNGPRGRAAPGRRGRI